MSSESSSGYFRSLDQSYSHLDINVEVGKRSVWIIFRITTTTKRVQIILELIWHSKIDLSLAKLKTTRDNFVEIFTF